VLTQADKDDESRELRALLILAGTDVLFFTDALKDAQQFFPTHLTSALSPGSNLPPSQLCAVPVLFLFFTRSIHKNRHAIFSQGSSAAQSNEQTLINSYRACALKAFSDCYDTVKQWQDCLDVWRCALALVEMLRDLQVVGYGARGNDALGAMASWSTASIANKTTGESKTARLCPQ
jgi:hypothetical protein